MNSWQRFKHSFETCRGPVIKREYHPPRKAVDGELEAWGPNAARLLDEMLYGVTLVHCRCKKCDATFTNRELGDTRDE